MTPMNEKSGVTVVQYNDPAAKNGAFCLEVSTSKSQEMSLNTKKAFPLRHVEIGEVVSETAPVKGHVI